MWLLTALSETSSGVTEMLAHLPWQSLRSDFVGLESVQNGSPSCCALWVAQSVMTGSSRADVDQPGPLHVWARDCRCT